VKLLVQFHRTGSSSSASSPSAVTAVPWSHTGGEREGHERAQAGRPGLLGRTEGADHARERERRSVGASAPHARASVWAERGEEKGKRPALPIFIFLFFKNVNSIQFYLFFL
jgi:hypothetical protein